MGGSIGGSEGRSGFHREALREPSVETARQRSHPLDAPPPQDQRHPGAAGLVGSGAVENDVAVPGDFVMASVQVLRAQP
jgi:hypothetical protein